LITSTPVVIAIYGAGALVLISGLGVVLLRSLDQVAMAFIGCLLMVAALAWVLGAPVVAAVQLAVAIVAAAGLLVVPGFRREAAPSEFSGQLIPGAIAAVAILALMAVALLRATWRTFVPGTGTTWGEYLVGLVVAALLVLVAAVGILSLPRARERPTGPIEAPASRRKRERR
jgi:NADH:ubiquinone oxidoreductase subunit 6 (subunit J)